MVIVAQNVSFLGAIYTWEGLQKTTKSKHFLCANKPHLHLRTMYVRTIAPRFLGATYLRLFGDTWGHLRAANLLG